MLWSPVRTALIATAIAGTLDIVAACLLAARAGMGVANVLLFVASGPFGDGMLGRPDLAWLGLVVHYGIMTAMAGLFVWAARRRPAITARPVVSGIVYGLLLWFLMYWIVRPARWAALPPPSDPARIAEQLFCHIILAGIPIALVARRGLARR